jgi:hypothetical protein
MPSPPPAHQRRHPRPSRNQRIARQAGRQNQAQNRDSSHLSADNSAFLELASLQFEALARQTASRQSASRHRSRSVSPLPDVVVPNPSHAPLAVFDLDLDLRSLLAGLTVPEAPLLQSSAVNLRPVVDPLLIPAQTLPTLGTRSP